MKLIIDTLGADLGEKVMVEGALEAEKNIAVQYIFSGNQEKIRELIKDHGKNPDDYCYIQANEKIENDEEPVRAIRSKKDSSMIKAIQALKSGEADALLSTGSTGALLAAGTLMIGRIKGVERPALCMVIPNLADGRPGTVLLDLGANVDCKAKMLYSFGVMGKEYGAFAFNKENPTVGLLNIGVEKGKGNEAIKEAYELFQDSQLNFIGNVEARDLLTSHADIVVCDGFIGNVALKTIEGTANGLVKILKDGIYSSLKTKIGGAMIKPVFQQMKSALDYNKFGAAPLLGVKKPIFKAHGSSSAKAIENGIYAASRFLEQDVIEKITIALGTKEVS